MSIFFPKLDNVTYPKRRVTELLMIERIRSKRSNFVPSGAILFLFGDGPTQKGDKNETARVAAPEIFLLLIIKVTGYPVTLIIGNKNIHLPSL